MAPIRRYLRITRHSVLECRIFLENPADGPRWLLNANDPALPRVIEAVKPYVLPKLREENERLKGKKKKKTVKDVVKQDDFEVSIFLTEIGTRHALMVKQKTVVDRQVATSDNKKTAGGNGDPLIIREESESDDDELQISDVGPETNQDDDESYKEDDRESSEADGFGDKKKLGFNTVYDGYSIWGFVLCLLVERKGSAVQKAKQGHAQALMEEWISTQQEQRDDS
ncbi:hypothetical protein DV735_g1248, partial [Chaetothyriales sp. CBS 134920]